ncbi:MAG: 3-oxoacyl-ACP reductase [Gammaproteobacteria bacterium]|nr:3-oxoacyl-ACP reductase [Gammaproteobacteria bacterium]RPG24756.1 MAG: glucose 1-dehydrogenase [Gammaproteobacteria bacterium TMED50]
MGRLADKTAVITGAASGFGAGIARRFVEEGARVLIADINESGARDIAASLGDSADYCRTDVTQASDVAAMCQAALSMSEKVDILVNNAGVTHFPGGLETIPEDEFDRVVNVNMRAVYLTSRTFVPLMKAQGGGVILNIASTAGISPRPGLSWYNASKGWLNTATRSMAVELAPDNIRVVALNPVAGETPLLATFMGGDTPENRERFLSTIPVGRFSTPEDLGNAAAWVCSDEAGMVTGSTIELDGGRTI